MTRALFLLLSVLLTPRVSHALALALVVDSEVRSKLSLSLDDLRTMNHQRIEVEDRGARVVYSGAPLTEVLRRAGLEIGRAPLQGTAFPPDGRWLAYESDSLGRHEIYVRPPPAAPTLAGPTTCRPMAGAS
jgi:hypothetical protein